MSGEFPDPEDNPSFLAEREVWKLTIEYLMGVREDSPGAIKGYLEEESQGEISSGHFYTNLFELMDMGVLEKEGEGEEQTYRLTDYGATLASKAQIGNQTLTGAEPLEPETEDIEQLLENDRDELEEIYEQEGYETAKVEARERAGKYVKEGRPHLAEELEAHVEELDK